MNDNGIERGTSALDELRKKKHRRNAALNGVESSSETSASRGAIQLSEDSLATGFEAKYSGRLLHAHNFGHWYRYSDSSGTWDRDRVKRVQHEVRLFVRDENSDGREKWSKASVVASVEKLASRAPGFAITGDELDADPWLLGTPSGVLDLRTGEMLPANPQHYVTKKTAVTPEKGTPDLWLKFLDEATAGDSQLQGYLQRLVGYCATGDTREEVLVFMYGSGGNGKGVFMNTVRELCGEYAKPAPMQIFLSNSGNRHPTELANLVGARLVLASESSEGQKWDEERIKSLTGRDTIAARFMNRDFFEYTPRFKIIVASNHKPRIRTVDDAWRRRLHLVPFDKKPPKPNPELKDQLRAEFPRILNWVIEGTEWWIREGLAAPACVRAATDEYFREEDVFRLWFEDCCDDHRQLAACSIERRALYSSYEIWCRGMGHAAATIYAMTRWFTQNGFEQDKSKSTRPIRGAALKPTPIETHSP